MLTCTIKANSLYQALSERAGTSEFELNVKTNEFLSEHGRFPHLDEIPNSNSEPYLKKLLKLDKYNSTNTNTILNLTGANSLLEAQIILNNEYSDLEIHIVDLGDVSIVKFRKRPSEYDLNFNETKSIDVGLDLTKSTLIISNALYKLKDLYGINIIPITNENISDFPIDVSMGQAFIYNGDIYINIEKASPDAPVHELLHMLLGATRYIDPILYDKLISQVLQFPNILDLSLDYPNRTLSDVMEEIFVDLFAKFITGLNSLFTDKTLVYEAMRQIQRQLDTILEGDYSVKLMENSKLVYSSLLDLSVFTNSSILNHKSTFLDLSAIHRVTANVKSDLFKSKQLIEQCN